MAKDKLPYNLRPQHRTLGQAEKKKSDKQVLVHARVEHNEPNKPNRIDKIYPYAGKKSVRKILSDSFAEVRGKYKK